ncbi:uncharacterized protein [Palaemon carinicauda]|uniref:uncharacterized protein n=2 Tax=Palaemon carinicauda TaxID=392227 RepID=UPI0035B62B7E
MSALLSLQRQQASSLETVTTPTPVVNLKNELRMPQVPLPEYDNTKGQCLVKFFYEFEKLTDKQNWSNHLKFMYLRNQLSKSPKALVDSLDIDNQSYDEAKKLLLQPFATPLTQKYDAIKKLVELKLTLSGDPYAFVASMKTIMNAFKKLDVKVDDVLQYFIWHGLNDRFQSLLIQITNESKPSLSEIESNIFEAVERYNRTNERNVEQKEKTRTKNIESSTTLATKVSVSPKYKSCILCTKDGKQDTAHLLVNCPVFANPKMKVEKLKELNACVRCGYHNHVTRQCKFKFTQRCRNCSGWHFTYLCVAKERLNSSSTKASDSSNTESTETSMHTSGKKLEPKHTLNSLTLAEIHQNVTGGAAILPTFTCSVAEENNVVRVLRDCGSQRNFICNKHVNHMKFPVLAKNVYMTIHGFNSTRDLVTDIVNVPLKLGREWHSIEAVVVPSIDIELKLEGLNVIVKEFQDRHYILADKFLSGSVDTIGNIGLILGNDADFLLSLTTHKFGLSNPSVYLDTPVGVMLTGNINRMMKNLVYLPNINIGNSSHTAVCTQGDTLCMEGEAAQTNRQLQFLDRHSFLAVSQSELRDDDVDLISNRSPASIKVQEANTNSTYAIFNKKGKLKQSELIKATEEMLEKQCIEYLDYEKSQLSEDDTETNKKLVKYVLDSTERDEEGRLVMPLMWNNKISHLLGKNFNLSRMILKSNLTRMKNKPEHLKMVNDVFKEQQNLGIIEKIEDINSFINEHPEASFLPHMPVFKMARDTTKCRVVFLSNLCEKNKSAKSTYSHNQCMLPGPCLNHKIATSLIMQRFDTHMICFDLKKAFLMIGLKEEDQNRLLFLWYRNILKGDFTVVGYRNKRLSFGLRPSPCHLMLALFKILILDVESDNEEMVNLKKSLYNTIYMDNGSYSCNSAKALYEAYYCLPNIFGPYKFELQQFVTNDAELQEIIDRDYDSETPKEVKLLGMVWDREADTLGPGKIFLDTQASTKRSILSTLNSIYDIFNIYGPILNRARLFLKKLQEDKTITWDSPLSETLKREWTLIGKQVNSTPKVVIPRFLGRRDGTYKLVAFSDASKDIYGTVVYIVNVFNGNTNFLTAKSRVVNKQLEKKTIPVIEFQALGLATETLISLFQELAGQSVVTPIKIVSMAIYSDSMVALNWLYSYTYKYDKLQKKGVFIQNRLKAIGDLCQVFPITFSFVNAYDNPADYISRCVSYRRLQKTAYHGGPEFLKKLHKDEVQFSFKVPNPLEKRDEVPGLEREDTSLITVSTDSESKENNKKDINSIEHLIPLTKFSSFHKLATVHKMVLKFIKNIREKLTNKGIDVHWGNCVKEKNLYALACRQIIGKEQENNFPEVCEFFKKSHTLKRNIPNLVTQMNIFQSKDTLLRIRSKFGRNEQIFFPVLLPKHSLLTKLLIRDMHVSLGHAGVYSILAQLRKQFWIIHFYSTVKKVLRECITCRRLNERPIKANQSAYRDFRSNPPPIPYRYIFIDYIGPYTVIWNGERKKIWLLCVTCLWSRAINLKICLSADTGDFLKAFQLHIYEFGIPEFCISDLGSQLTAGSRIIGTFLNDFETHAFFEENDIKPLKFEHYAKGNSSLGSLVESCVKMVKKLILSSIKNTVLDYQDFYFLICQTVHLINKRPIAFKDSLRDACIDNVEKAITPECLLKGYDLVSVNIIPELQNSSSDDTNWEPGSSAIDDVKDNYYKLRQGRNRLVEAYHSEFLATLINQAVDKRDRYRPVNHKTLAVGDIVLLKEDASKPSTYPLGIVKKTEVNHLGEVKAARVLKGKSREVVYRTTDSLILLLPKEGFHTVVEVETELPIDQLKVRERSKRAAALESMRNTELLVQEGLV